MLLYLYLVICQPNIYRPNPLNLFENVDNNVGTQSEDTNNNSNNKTKENPASISNLSKPDTDNYKLIKVDGGDTNGHHQSNVVVN